VLGYLDPDSFLGGRMHLDRELALRALAALGAKLGMEAEEVAVGVFRIINSQMADLIRKSTIELGHDPRECVLVAYGGAGPTHAVFYGHEIGSKAILVLADSTVFSAEGMLTCDVTHTAEASRVMSTPFTDESLAALTERFTGLEQRVSEQFAREGAGRDEISLARTIGVRFRQQVHTVEVEVDPGTLDAAAGERVLARFVERYGQVYGEGALLLGGGNEVELHRVVGTRPIEPVAFPQHESEGADASAALKGERNAYFEPAGLAATRVYDGDALRAGNTIDGPAVIERMGDSVVVPPGFRAQVDRFLTIRLAAAAPGSNGGGSAARAEAA
jgi:N-methylhydantoinase A